MTIKEKLLEKLVLGRTGELIGWWVREPGWGKCNCFSPYFNNHKQAHEWLDREIEIVRVHGDSKMLTGGFQRMIKEMCNESDIRQ